MTLPKLTLTWPKNVRVYYDSNSRSWSSDYDVPVVREAYIALMQFMTHEAFYRDDYTPFPFLDRMETLANELSFTLDGMPELYDALQAEVDRMIEDDPDIDF